MTAQEYQAAGYKLSLQTDQAVIDGAEALVRAAYIVPIVGAFDEHDEDQVRAMMCLAYIRMSLAQIFATRSGGKEKNAAQSFTASREAVLQEFARTADTYLRKLGDTKAVDDVLQIYFITNFLNL